MFVNVTRITRITRCCSQKGYAPLYILNVPSFERLRSGNIDSGGCLREPAARASLSRAGYHSPIPAWNPCGLLPV